MEVFAPRTERVEEMKKEEEKMKNKRQERGFAGHTVNRGVGE